MIIIAVIVLVLFLNAMNMVNILSGGAPCALVEPSALGRSRVARSAPLRIHRRARGRDGRVRKAGALPGLQ